MTIVFPIGGRGGRFKQAGYRTPKPFIKIGEDRLVDLAIRSYPPPVAGNVHLFIVRKEYQPEFDFPVETISGDTRGPLETILSSEKAVREIDSAEDILIADCDSVIDSEELRNATVLFRQQGARGGVTIRASSNPAYSYARLDEGNWVLETREKDPFSAFTTTGPYWWKRGADFIRYAREAVQNGIFSVCPVYNYLIRDGGRVKAVPTCTFFHLGTPDEFYEYASSLGLRIQT